MLRRPAWLLVSLILSACLLASSTASANGISIQLSGRTDAQGGDLWDHGYGGHGLWLGKKFSSYYLDNSYMNWRWDDVSMWIDTASGDASITGSMTRLYDSSEWGLSIQLSGYQGSAHAGMVDDMISGSGMLEWDTVAMQLSAPYDTSVPTTGWVGYAMPNIGHDNPAELSWDAEHGIQMDLWYRNPTHYSYYYRVGDTKGNGDPSVPEPTAALVFGAGLVVLGARRRFIG